MDNLLYTYALIKSLSDEGEDYIDAFWPFTVKIFPINTQLKIDLIQRKLVENYNLDIPLHVLTSILNRAKLKGYFSYSNGKYLLSEKGKRYQSSLESENEVNRRLKSLFEDIRVFFSEKGRELDNDQIKEILYIFIQKNLAPLIEFFNPVVSKKTLDLKTNDDSDEKIMEYIRIAEERKPDVFSTLTQILLGSLIYSIVYSPESQELVKIKGQKCKECKVYLDSNFVFSLLNLHTSDYNKPANELYKILKEFKFSLYVFNFTVDEICRVLNRYGEESFRYPKSIRVDTIYSSIKVKGWTKSTARKFISEIEEHLAEKNISIDYAMSMDISKYDIKNPQLLDSLETYKPNQYPIAQKHDIAVIEFIQKIRQKDVRKLESAVAIFVTSDRGLSKFDLIELQHKEKGTIPEIILDRIFTGILWLSDPKIRISLDSIVAAHSRDLFVKRRIWDRFYFVLQQLKTEHRISDDDVSLLLMDKHLESELVAFDESQVDQITPKLVMEKIEEAALVQKETTSKEIQAIEKEFLDKLETRVNQAELKKDEEWLTKIETVKENARNMANGSAKNTILLIKGILIAVLLLLVYVFYSAIEPLFALIPLVVLIIVIFGLAPLNVWNYISERFSKRYYHNILKGMQLEDDLKML